MLPNNQVKQPHSKYNLNYSLVLAAAVVITMPTSDIHVRSSVLLVGITTAIPVLSVDHYLSHWGAYPDVDEENVELDFVHRRQGRGIFWL